MAFLSTRRPFKVSQYLGEYFDFEQLRVGCGGKREKGGERYVLFLCEIPFISKEDTIQQLPQLQQLPTSLDIHRTISVVGEWWETQIGTAL